MVVLEEGKIVGTGKQVQKKILYISEKSIGVRDIV